MRSRKFPATWSAVSATFQIRSSSNSPSKQPKELPGDPPVPAPMREGGEDDVYARIGGCAAPTRCSSSVGSSAPSMKIFTRVLPSAGNTPVT